MKKEYTPGEPRLRVEGISVVMVRRDKDYMHSYKNGRSFHGFIYIFSAGGSSPRILHSSDIPRVFERDTPTLALDISEHAYFADYGFERDNYLKSAVARLDINKLFLPKDLT